MDLALNNQQRLICHKNQPTNQPTTKDCPWTHWTPVEIAVHGGTDDSIYEDVKDFNYPFVYLRYIKNLDVENTMFSSHADCPTHTNVLAFSCLLERKLIDHFRVLP